MSDGFAPHMGSKELFSDLGVTVRRASLFPFSLGLNYIVRGFDVIEQVPSTHDGHSLQRWCSAVEDKDRFDTIEK